METSLVGRQRERRLLGAALDAATRGGAVLVLCGEPGIGKTTLLDHVAAVAPGQVLRVSSVQSEAILPYATLADLLLPLRRHFADLPAVQRETLEVCLALADGAPANPYSACAATLNLFAAAGEADPLAILLDDLHWADPASQRVLLFAARRVAAERLALVATVRDERMAATAGLPVLRLDGLPEPDCGRLLAARGLAPAPEVLTELVRLTGGNPLALVETAAALDPGQLRGERPLAAAADRLETLWTRRLHGLPPETAEALTAAAASRSTESASIGSALAALGLSPAALLPAEQADLLSTAGDHLTFRHPALRSLVTRQAPLAVRRRVYRALAAVSAGALQAWYLAAGSAGPDDEVAAALAGAAQEARRRGAFDAAAVAWRRAAELTTDERLRGRRLRDAAADAFLGGATADAGAWCADAWSTTTDPADRADLELLHGRVRTWLGHGAEAHRRLVEAAHEIAGADPAGASRLLAEAVAPAVFDARLTEAHDVARESVALAGTWHPRVGLAQTLVLLGRIADGSAELSRILPELAAADPLEHNLLLVTAAQTAHWADDPDRARCLVGRAIDAARRSCAPAALPYALAVRAELDLWAGRWAAAEADAVEALRWSEELQHVTATWYSIAQLARLAAARGDRARCETLVARGRRMAGPYRIGAMEAYFSGVLGLAALADGDHEQAIEQLARTFDQTRRHGLTNPLTVPFAADLAEAYVRVGDVGSATEVLGVLEQQAKLTGLAWPAAAAARCRGLLATDLEEARSWFSVAEVAHRRRETPFEHARTQLCRGEALRRLRRPAAARRPLAAALATFEALAAEPWAARAAQEHAATGLRPGDRSGPAPISELSPQELQVARAVAGGLNNGEAAATLFLSRKTVEAHLTRVYRKLGLRTRTDLARLFAAQDPKPARRTSGRR